MATAKSSTVRNREQHKFDLSKISAKVDRVNVSGLLRTHNDYVMKAAQGLFKARNFEEVMFESMNAKSYLHELGIFKDISVHIDVSHGDTASPDGYEVTFKGKELSRILGSVGTEFGQNEGSLRTELTVPNLLGRGESISLQGSYSSKRANDVQLKFWKSYFHTRFMKNRPDHSVQYEASIRELSLLGKIVPMAIRQQCGPKLASLMRYSLIFDQRDNPVFPTNGIMLKAINEYCGLGGNIAYVSSCVHGEVSLPLFSGIVAQVCGRVGIVKETKKTDYIPLSNLYLCGGPLTLRGFKYGGAGPVVEGTPIGAETYWSTGFHLWAPLPYHQVFKSFANNFRTHVFYNAGNFNTFSIDHMRTAFGVGLAFKLAERARIELNYCIPLRSYASDKLNNGFQFGIGYEFV
uniref:POTRA domain-containing protein n=1 Tax=Glossina brevipalpis TaxID=37001 RepID=A0A1A9WV47_9MUSC